MTTVQTPVTVHGIDHTHLKIPADGIETALAFYHDILGFDIENRDLYEAGRKNFFSIRLGNESVIHLTPATEFESPSGDSFDHIALRIEESLNEVKELFTVHDIDIERELTPIGATGAAPAIYIRDPFGYLIEMKETR